MSNKHTRRTHLAASIALSLALSACGGGGGSSSGNIKPDAPPPTAPPPAPKVCEDTSANNHGGPLPCAFDYNGTPDNLLVTTGAYKAHEQGFTGKGVKVGLLDNGAMDVDYPAFDRKEAFYADYTNAAPDGKHHGLAMATLLAGDKAGTFKGGIAPDAEIYWGRVCVGDECHSSSTSRAIKDMADRGVRLFNYSIGAVAGPGEDAIALANLLAPSLMPVHAVDGLFVAATGNDGGSSPATRVRLPITHPELGDNILGVTALALDSKGNPIGLADYANHCGDAAQWCLASPALFELPAIPGTPITWAIQGTSSSTAAVTGIAALVWQAYPWMSGSNVQQTLLTTATDMGDAGVDALYGWGAVNAGKAVNGPGQFVADFKADVTSGDHTFSNDIGGLGGLLKTGGGSLWLSGSNTFAGDTIINAGALGFSRDTASSVAVNNGGTYTALGGKIGGNYTANAGANTQIALGNPLAIAGTANLDGKLTLTPEAADYTVKGTESLLTAGGIAGTFKETAYGNGLFWAAALDYTGTSVDATMTRVAASATTQSFGLTAASVDGARQFDSLTGELDKRVTAGNTEGLDSLLSTAAGLMHSDLATAAASLESLTGQIHGIQRTVSVQGAINDARVLADRLPHLASTTATTGWAQATHLDGNLDRDGYASADYRQDMFSVGVDLPMGDAVVGVAISGGEIRANINESRSHLESDRIGVSAYGYLPFDTAYLSGVVGYDQSKVDTRRDVMTGNAIEQVLAKRDESSIHARIELGASLANGLTPFAAIGGIRQTQDAFAETSTSGLGLSANKDSLSLGYTDVGLRHREQANGWTFDSMVSYRNVFDGDRTDFDAWFTALPDASASFTINGQSIAKDSLRASFGIGYQMSRNVFAYGNVGLERSSDSHDNATATVGVRWLF